jgi:hypothetical protein
MPPGHLLRNPFSGVAYLLEAINAVSALPGVDTA